MTGHELGRIDAAIDALLANDEASALDVLVGLSTHGNARVLYAHFARLPNVAVACEHLAAFLDRVPHEDRFEVVVHSLIDFGSRRIGQQGALSESTARSELRSLARFGEDKSHDGLVQAKVCLAVLGSAHLSVADRRVLLFLLLGSIATLSFHAIPEMIIRSGILEEDVPCEDFGEPGRFGANLATEPVPWLDNT